MLGESTVERTKRSGAKQGWTPSKEQQITQVKSQNRGEEEGVRNSIACWGAGQEDEAEENVIEFGNESLPGNLLELAELSGEQWEEAGVQGVGWRKGDDECLHFSFRKFGREREERTGS